MNTINFELQEDTLRAPMNYVMEARHGMGWMADVSAAGNLGYTIPRAEALKIMDQHLIAV